MELIRDAVEYRRVCEEARARVHPLGFVPTMGAFHHGHRALMRRAAEERDTAIVSLFVNPLQFGEDEDFGTYPRDEARDSATAEAEGIDILFVPSVEDVYPDGVPPPASELVDPGPLGDVLEGASRPGHFRGMLTVVARLFELTGGCRADFGEKDAQQVFLVSRMARERFSGVEVVSCPTVREDDGLALSSRNASFDGVHRRAATCLHRGLRAAASRFGDGDHEAHVLRKLIEGTVAQEPLATLDYAAIVDDATFEPIEDVIEPGHRARALVAAKVGPVRLIDNLRLG